MAVKIRLKKMGSKKRPFFRLVAADSRSPRDGRFIENLGYYNPISDPPEIKLDDDKIYRWLDNGAQPTDNAKQILKAAGLLERWQLLRDGVKIADLDASITARREKQPKAVPKTEKKISKERAAEVEAEEAEAEEASAAGTETGPPADEKPVAGEEPAAEPAGGVPDAPEREEPSGAEPDESEESASADEEKKSE